MQPLQNLKRFLALLLILIVPAVLTVAYFRNYSPNAKHEHGGGDEGGMEHGAMPGMKAASQAEPMSHEKMDGMQGGESMQHGAAPQPSAPDQAQIEASRLQLEASRLQLEASRKQLEAADAAKKQMASPAPQQTQPVPSPESTEHKHEP